MRRQLVDDLPLLMRIYPGLKPWDLDRMTFREVQTVLDHAERLMREGDDGQ